MRNLAMHCLILRPCGSIKIFASRIIKTSLKKRAESHRWADFIMGLIHQIINDQSKTLPFFITRSNVYDRKSVPHLVKDLAGRLFIRRQGLYFEQISSSVGNMEYYIDYCFEKEHEACTIDVLAKLLPRKRSIIEILNDQLRNILT
jgi:hypothetical protein